MTIQQKIPLSRSLPQLATKAANDAQAQIGLRLPGHVVSVSGSIVTVNFDVQGATIPQATMAIAMSAYDRIPIQVNDKGYATTADAYLGNVTGLGGGTADLTRWGNLSNLVWVPVSNKAWATPDSTARILYSANGQASALVGNTQVKLALGSGSVVMNSSGITLSFGGKSIIINSSGVTIDGILWDTHYHPGVTTGGGITGGPA